MSVIFMLGIVCAVFGFVILAPVYVVRKELISKLITPTCFYLARKSTKLDIECSYTEKEAPTPGWSLPGWIQKCLGAADLWFSDVKRVHIDPAPNHRKNRGRHRRNRLSMLFFLTMLAGVGGTTKEIRPDSGMNPYAESGIQQEWLQAELGLQNWRVIYPVLLCPHRVLPIVIRKSRVRWAKQREAKRQRLLKKRLRKAYPPWDGNVSRWVYQHEPKPPCDVPSPFFGVPTGVPPPSQDGGTCAVLEDPIHGESPYLWDEKGELMCMPVQIDQAPVHARFDTDSGTCGIDNRASASMSPYKADFTGPLIEEKRVIRGFEGAKVYTIYKGTLLLTIQDDHGHVDEVQIPNSYYVPSCPYRIISPQHWAQEIKDVTDDGTGCTTYSDRAILFWNGGTRQKTVPIDKQNVFTFELPSGYTRFHSMCATCEIDPLKGDDEPDILGPADLTCHLFHPERDGPQGREPELQDKAGPFYSGNFGYQQKKVTHSLEHPSHKQREATTHPDVHVQLRPSLEKKRQEPTRTEDPIAGVKAQDTTVQKKYTDQPENMFDLNQDSEEKQADVVTEEEMQKPTENDSAELLRYHHKFGHVSFARLQAMARQGTLPAKLAKCPIPLCASCFYGKATKRATATKTPVSILPQKKITQPGQVVSVDCLTSADPGLIAQMAGGLTNARYLHVCVFVDHYSDLSYVHLLKTQSGEEVLEAKEAFEAYSSSFGIDIRHYHADNGIFNGKAWRQSCSESHQGLSFAGVNAHHQNGRAERRVRSLQDMARTMLIHANHRWPQAITANLWPYAIRAANDSLNVTPCARHKFKVSPIQVFSRSEVDINPTHWIPFGSPVYVLAAPLQGSARIQNKWKERARLGIYLGRSPMHARSVALVLSLETGLVSPQYHIMFDPSFRTVHPDQSNQVPKSQWQKKCGFSGPHTRTVVQGNQVIEEPDFISPTDVAIIPEADAAASEPASDVTIRVPDPEESLPIMEEVNQLETVEPQPEPVQRTETGPRRSSRRNRGVRTEPTFQMLQEAERGLRTTVPGESFQFCIHV